MVSAHTQVVQGTMYHLLIEVEEESKPKHYEAKVWVKTWEHFKKLESFTPKDGTSHHCKSFIHGVYLNHVANIAFCAEMSPFLSSTDLEKWMCVMFCSFSVRTYRTELRWIYDQ